MCACAACWVVLVMVYGAALRSAVCGGVRGRWHWGWGVGPPQEQEQEEQELGRGPAIRV
jgi:hypothetical protein